MKTNTVTTARQPLAAATLSFLLPGLGQIYCGSLLRALVYACLSLTTGLLFGFLLMQTRAPLATLAMTAAFGTAISVVSAIGAFRLAGNPQETSGTSSRAVCLLFALLTLGASSGGAMGLSYLIRDRFVEAFVIPSESMIPAIVPGDRILARKHVYLDRDPERGDIVVFPNPEKRRQSWIKRVVALPGETVALSGGKLLINGQPREVENLETSGMDEAPDFAPITVPAGHCFVLGDNRAVSRDSRHFGPVSISLLRARAETRFWPLSRHGSLRP